VCSHDGWGVVQAGVIKRRGLLVAELCMLGRAQVARCPASGRSRTVQLVALVLCVAITVLAAQDLGCATVRSADMVLAATSAASG
jgi:hypothetical protein